MARGTSVQKPFFFFLFLSLSSFSLSFFCVFLSLSFFPLHPSATSYDDPSIVRFSAEMLSAAITSPASGRKIRKTSLVKISNGYEASDSNNFESPRSRKGQSRALPVFSQNQYGRRKGATRSFHDDCQASMTLLFTDDFSPEIYEIPLFVCSCSVTSKMKSLSDMESMMGENDGKKKKEGLQSRKNGDIEKGHEPSPA